MLSKRKAMIGYGVYTLGKPLAKMHVRRQSRAAKRKKLAGAIAAAVAAAGVTVGGLMFWRRRRSGDAEST